MRLAPAKVLQGQSELQLCTSTVLKVTEREYNSHTQRIVCKYGERHAEDLCSPQGLRSSSAIGLSS